MNFLKTQIPNMKKIILGFFMASFNFVKLMPSRQELKEFIKNGRNSIAIAFVE